jgi:transposase-like protein
MNELLTDPALIEAIQTLGRKMKSPADLATLNSELIRITIEAALNGEMEVHLGYSKHSVAGYNTGNNRNGYNRKTLKGQHGEIEISSPRDRKGQFEPAFITKYQTRLSKFDEQILTLYAKGMSTRDITDTMQEMYGAEVSPGLVSQVTESVRDKIIEWQNRPLDAIYPVIYMDCIHLKIRQDKQIISKAIYLVLGINLHGHKELLGMWISENEGAKFWLSVLTELKNRGVQDVMVACVDGLKGFPDAISAVFPKTQVQLCIVHMVRNSLKFVAWKDRKEVAEDLKVIYHSVSVEEAEMELRRFADKWDVLYPKISASWRENWANLIAFFQYPKDIRKVIYTTNAIESLNSVIRKACNNHKLFPNDNAALKVVFLAVEQTTQKWTMPIQNWQLALNQFMIFFEGRFPSNF